MYLSEIKSEKNSLLSENILYLYWYAIEGSIHPILCDLRIHGTCSVSNVVPITGNTVKLIDDWMYHTSSQRFSPVSDLQKMKLSCCNATLTDQPEL